MKVLNLWSPSAVKKVSQAVQETAKKPWEPPPQPTSLQMSAEIGQPVKAGLTELIFWKREIVGGQRF